jgi:hypothetical protein
VLDLTLAIIYQNYGEREMADIDKPTYKFLRTETRNKYKEVTKKMIGCMDSRVWSGEKADEPALLKDWSCPTI